MLYKVYEEIKGAMITQNKDLIEPERELSSKEVTFKGHKEVIPFNKTLLSISCV